MAAAYKPTNPLTPDVTIHLVCSRALRPVKDQRKHSDVCSEATRQAILSQRGRFRQPHALQFDVCFFRLACRRLRAMMAVDHSNRMLHCKKIPPQCKGLDVAIMTCKPRCSGEEADWRNAGEKDPFVPWAVRQNRRCLPAR